MIDTAEKQELHEHATRFWNSLRVAEKRQYRKDPASFRARMSKDFYRGWSFLGKNKVRPDFEGAAQALADWQVPA